MTDIDGEDGEAGCTVHETRTGCGRLRTVVERRARVLTLRRTRDRCGYRTFCDGAFEDVRAFSACLLTDARPLNRAHGATFVPGGAIAACCGGSAARRGHCRTCCGRAVTCCDRTLRRISRI